MDLSRQEDLKNKLINRDCEHILVTNITIVDENLDVEFEASTAHFK